MSKLLDNSRWVLAFDAACSTCREVSNAVTAAAGSKLEVLPLEHPEIVVWREESEHNGIVHHAPTLFKVTSSTVVIRQGRSMAIPLMQRLGIRSTIAVMGALGQLKSEATKPIPPSAEQRARGRRNFLKIGMGAVVAGSIVFAGNTPAFAEDRMKAAEAWVKANQNRLPHAYNEFVQYQLTYRRAIYSQLTAPQRAQLWITQLDLAVEKRALTKDQTDLIDRARRALLDGILDANKQQRDALTRQFSTEAKSIFNKQDAGDLFARLGPDNTTDGGNPIPTPDCACAIADSYCVPGTCKKTSYKCVEVGGCGTWWSEKCDGMCY